ncbi:MAG: hypothetical protein Q8M37_12035 [Nevskia sp.]|nr:hypothetical protein [Nevskia sp.]
MAINTRGTGGRSSGILGAGLRTLGRSVLNRVMNELRDRFREETTTARNWRI